MDAKELFLRRCRQVASLLESHDEGDLLDLSAYLRTLLCDQHCLVDTVNRRKDRVPLEFHVGSFSQKPDEFTALLSLEDGIDPETRHPGAPWVVLTHKQFLRHVVVHSYKESLTVLDVIKHATNVAGGVHHDPYDKRLLARLSQRHSIGNLPLGIRMLKAIARVTMRALDPLIKRIEGQAS